MAGAGVFTCRVWMDFPNIRLSDVVSVLTVSRRGTVTGAARELEVTPSQVSKSISRLQRQLRATLLERTGRGMVATPVGLRLLPQLQDVLSRIRLVSSSESISARTLTLAAPSSLIAGLLPAITQGLPAVQFRGLEMSPHDMHHYASEKLFDVALSSVGLPFPNAWTVTQVGELREGLLARPQLAAHLGPAPLALARLREVRFIGPVAAENGRLVPSSDNCPLPASERRIGCQAQTMHLALKLAACSDQVVFGPLLAARTELEAGHLVEIPVDGWDVRRPLFVLCNADVVLASELKGIVVALQEALRQHSAGDASRAAKAPLDPRRRRPAVHSERFEPRQNRVVERRGP
jgi:DNA-binding transcriptional LysR family regulator